MEIVALRQGGEDVEAWLERAEPLHRQLRPDAPRPYARHMQLMLGEGAEMALAVDAGAVRALAVFRTHLTTFHGRRFYVDDLVTDPDARSQGIGGKLLAWLEEEARRRDCGALDLESGVHRPAAHRFYFRHGMTIFAFGFTKPLKD